jgi:hypothetical protein
VAPSAHRPTFGSVHIIASQQDEFAKGSLVLAMFPKTTSFYCAVVLGGPKKRKSPE